jgi:sialate O-acetylesterase
MAAPSPTPGRAAEAQVDGSTVIVSSEQVSAPVFVRFGWHEEAEPNLVNGAGLPVAPFRSHR